MRTGPDAAPGQVAPGDRPDDPPFVHVAIVGLGLIGGSLSLALRRAWPGLRLTGIDRGHALAAARGLGVLDLLHDALGSIAGADLVVLAAPVRQNLALLPAVVEVVGDGAVVTDVGSTKRAIAAAAVTLAPRGRFIGGHPLSGAARGGLDLARGDLFRERSWLLTDVSGQAGDLDRVRRLVAAVGARPVVLDADAHDALLAYVSHLPQLASSALMHVAGSAVGEEGLHLSGPGLNDITRLAGSPADIWLDICATNADAIRAALDAYIGALAELRDHLDDAPVLRRTFTAARRWRAEIE